MRAAKLLIPYLFLSLGTASLRAQKVLYSPFIGNQSATRFEVIGKAGSYYWVQTSKTKSTYKKPAEPWLDDKELKFEIYDERMNLLKEVPSFLSVNLIKEYLIPGDQYFDQLILQPANQKIVAVLHRYTPDGGQNGNQDTIAEFPGNLKCGDFLLVRSQDKNKILLLGFETVPDSPTKLHALLYDKEWKLICEAEYSNRNISKPLVQYDLVEYPLEDYNSASIKLGNNGECLMILSSGTNRNYILGHFGEMSDGFSFKEIKLPANTTVEDAGLYFDNGKQEGFAGILSRMRTSAIKNVRSIHYSLRDFHIDFDTSYILNTLAGNRRKNENIYEEYFMTIPDKGFLLLKEYGRAFSFDPDDAGVNHEIEQTDPTEKSLNKPAPQILNKDEYTRYDNLAGTRSNFDRGDLSLYYFPANGNDSCWSGIINKEQVTELGTSYLSYVFLPKKDKLFFLYNSIYRNASQYSSSTVLDQKGNPVNEGLEYWQIRNTMVFQKARQISEDELAIPYERNMRNGFAIISL
jgi:hypothetical protein